MRKPLVVLLFLLLILPITSSPCLVESLPSAKLVYYINVKENANATITIVFEAKGSGVGFIGLPLFEEYKVSVHEGEIKWLDFKPVSVFYTNASFSFRGKNIRMVITYNFPYATLIAEDKAWFMSPYILASSSFEVFVEVELYGLDPSRKVRFWPYEPLKQHGNKFTFAILNPVSDNRVIIEYKLSEKVPNVDYRKAIGESEVVVRVAKYYRHIADKVFYVLEKTYEELEYVFGELPDKLEFEFYLPELNDLSALGYVKERTIEMGVEGPIYLNLALIRFKEGFLEETVIHECVHVVLGLIGVSSNREIRWFHEGMAEYVAIKVCSVAGINVTDFIKMHREGAREALKLYGGDLSFIIYWEYSTPMARLYYSAAFYIMNKTAEENGGLVYVKKLVREIEKQGGADSNEEVIQAMSKAAGKDLRRQFRKWGFPVTVQDENGGEDLGNNESKEKQLIKALWETIKLLVIMVVIAVIVLATILGFIIYWFLKRRRGLLYSLRYFHKFSEIEQVYS